MKIIFIIIFLFQKNFRENCAIFVIKITLNIHMNLIKIKWDYLFWIKWKIFRLYSGITFNRDSKLINYNKMCSQIIILKILYKKKKKKYILTVVYVMRNYTLNRIFRMKMMNTMIYALTVYNNICNMKLWVHT